MISPVVAQEDCVSYSEVQIWVDGHAQFDFSFSSDYEIDIEAVTLGIGSGDVAGFNMTLYQWDDNNQSTRIAEGVYVSGMSFIQDMMLEPARYSIMLWWENSDVTGVIQVSLIFNEVVPGYRSVFLQGSTSFGLEHFVYVQPGTVTAEVTRGEQVTCQVYDYNSGSVVGSFGFGSQTQIEIPVSYLHGHEHNQTYVLCDSPRGNDSYRARLYFEPDFEACGNASPTLGEVLGEE